MLLFIAVVFLLFYLLFKNNRYLLPKSFAGWVGGVVLLLLAAMSSLILARITVVKPGVMAIITQLESLRGNKAPPLHFQLIADGSTHSIDEYRGKVVLVNYWATWCAPCLKELPDLNLLQKNYADQGLVVLAVSDEDPERIEKYAIKNPFTLMAARVPSFEWVNLGSERPASFLIDTRGVVRAYYTGPYDYAFFEKEIKGLLKE